MQRHPRCKLLQVLAEADDIYVDLNALRPLLLAQLGDLLLNVLLQAGLADEAEGGVPLPARWAGMQGLTDLGFLFLLSSYTGRDLVDLFQDSATKYIVFGPALLTAGVVGNQFRLPERPDFEQNPVVKFLGGPARVRNFRGVIETKISSTGFSSLAIVVSTAPKFETQTS